MLDFPPDYPWKFEVVGSTDHRVVSFDLPLTGTNAETYLHINICAERASHNYDYTSCLSSSFLLAGLGLLAISGRRRYYRTK